MKKILFLFIALASASYAWAQKPVKPEMPMDEEGKLVLYQGVVQVGGVDKMELYRRANIFLKQYYAKYTSNTFQEQDSVKGKIEMKSQFDTYKTLKNGVKAKADLVKYTFTLDVKDGKYRYTFERINLQAPSYKPIEVYLNNDASPTKEEQWAIATQANEYFEKTIELLREGMEKPSKKVKKDDW